MLWLGKLADLALIQAPSFSLNHPFAVLLRWRLPHDTAVGDGRWPDCGDDKE